MKKLLLCCLPVLLVLHGQGQTLFTYGKNTVSKGEFIKAFNKNPVVEGERKAALKEYLNLYINFKLKVQAAYDAKLQDDAVQIAELQNFKLQIAENIMNDEANISLLVQEAFDRSQKDIHLGQIFIEVPVGGDTTEAYKRINVAYNQLKQGKDFFAVGNDYTNDQYTLEAGGDLGFITVFTLPHLFENVAYQTPANTFSVPFRSNLGYHIFKNIEDRSPFGKRKVAHILLALPPVATTSEKLQAAQKADSVYALLKKGGNFGEMVRAISNDVASINSNGVLKEFGIGEYNPAFEKQAFSLTEPGQLSAPFENGAGYHILQLVEVLPVGTDRTNIEAMAEMQEKIARSERLLLAKRIMIDRQMKQIGYTPVAIDRATLWKLTDTLMQSKTRLVAGVTDKSILFSFAKQKFSVADWVAHVQLIKSDGVQPQNSTYDQLLNDYVQLSATDYYRNHLDDYSGEYKQQVKEFKDANLLFGIMDTNVWSKANNDSAGLQAYYDSHKQKFIWNPSAEVLVVTCSNKSVVEEIQQKLQLNPNNWKVIVESYASQVVADSGRYEFGQLAVIDRTRFTKGLLTAPVNNQADNSVTFNYIFNVYNGGEPRTFDDSKGLVISDYQLVLEQKWIAVLKKKYPVKVNMPVFNTIK